MQFEQFQKIPIYKDHLNYINLIFNMSLNNNLNNSPYLKLGFLNGTNNFLDRMFVVEETLPIITFVKNVQIEYNKNSYRRSVYMISRRKTKLIHFDTGIIFNDLFDYCHIEQEEVKNYINFLYNDIIYTNIKDISIIDNNYKIKTKIIIISNGSELINDILYYCYNFQNDITKKIGYYIPLENQNYFHVVHFFPSNFGKINNPPLFFQNLLNDSNNIYNLINFVFEDPNLSLELIKINKQKNKTDVSYNNSSLITQLATNDDLQGKKMIIGWFLCEIMYQFIFYE